MPQPLSVPELDIEVLRCEIRKEYAAAEFGTLGVNFRAVKPLSAA